MEFNESEIISECVGGKWQNFDKLYDLYLPKIYQYVYYRIRHKETAEDLTSVVFMKAVKNLASFKQGSAPFVAWLYRIARNTIIDHVRTSKPVQDLETAFGVADKQNVMDQADTTLKLAVVKSEMEKLSDLQREVVTMRVWDGLSHREISEILEISEGSSKVAYSRAVENLKQRIEKI